MVSTTDATPLAGTSTIVPSEATVAPLLPRVTTTVLQRLASSEMAELKKGNCIKNLHHFGDRFWNAYKKI